MEIVSIRTDVIRPRAETVTAVLARYLPQTLPDGCIVAIASKIVSVCEGAVVPRAEVPYDELVVREADRYVPAELNHHGFPITIKHGLFIGSAGVDESNADDQHVVLPRDPQASANAIRAWLAERYGPRVGVIVTDSRSLPLRRGTTGIGLAHSGFAALVDHSGEPDIFGRRLETTASNVLDGLAAAAVVLCGEAAEQTPLALISDVPFVAFTERDPSEAELAAMRTTLESDYWAPFFAAVPWKPGGGGDPPPAA